MIDYEALQQDALRGIVRAALTQVAAQGLAGEHHFFVTFNTKAPGVILSKRLKEKYPYEMTIVLQHRFWDLIVSQERFEVNLTFDSIPERLVVPYTALRTFADPSVTFAIQFDEAAARGTPPADRRALTMDAAYDAIGEVRSDSPRAALSKKPRTPRRAKPDKDQPALPTSLAERRALEKDVPQPAPASSAAANQPLRSVTDDEKDGGDKSGAEIVRLDAFRKK